MLKLLWSPELRTVTGEKNLGLGITETQQTQAPQVDFSRFSQGKRAVKIEHARNFRLRVILVENYWLPAGQPRPNRK